VVVKCDVFEGRIQISSGYEQDAEENIST